jgi:hypothetical protein
MEIFLVRIASLYLKRVTFTEGLSKEISFKEKENCPLPMDFF